MVYKKGDKVLIITNSNDYEYHGLTFGYEMNKYSGKIMTIDSFNAYCRECCMIEDGSSWWWSIDWLMKVGV